MEKIVYYQGTEDPVKSAERRVLLTSLQLVYAQRENRELKLLLRGAVERLQDMLKMDDGQAAKEADKFVARVQKYFDKPAQIDVV
jgi:hypothetical protein